MEGKVWWIEYEVTGHTESTVRERKEVNAVANLQLFTLTIKTTIW